MTAPRSDEKTSFLKVLAPIVIIVLFVMGGLSFIQSRLTHSPETNSSQEIASDQILPDFSLTTLDGQKVPVSSKPYKIMLINFWATWCEACLEEMPSLVNLRNRYKDQGFEILGINLDENPEAVLSRTLRQFKIEFPVFKDTEGELSDLFNVHAIPFTVIMDHQRKILFVKHGELDWDSSEVHSKIERWLAK